MEEANGKGTIEAYTVIHRRDGEPHVAVVYGRDGTGRRFVGNADTAAYATLREFCRVGDPVEVAFDPRAGVNWVRIS